MRWRTNTALAALAGGLLLLLLYLGARGFGAGEPRGLGGTSGAPAAAVDGGARVEPDRAAGSRVPEPVADTAPGGLRVTVLDAETAAALAGARVVARIEAAPGAPASAPVEGRADADGVVVLSVPAGAAIELFVAGPRAGAGSERLALEALAHGEERAVTVRVPMPVATRYWGRLVAAQDGSPVAEARVHLLRGGALPPVDLVATAREVDPIRPHADGVFAVPLESLRAHHLLVAAPGFGPILVLVAGGHAAPEEAETLALERAGALDVRVVDAAGGAVGALRVRVSAPSHEVSRPDGRPILGTSVVWSAALAGDGRATFDDLPSRVSLAAEVLRADAVVFTAPAPLRLAPGERREVEWTVGGGARLVVDAVIDAGRPAVGVPLWLVGTGGEGVRGGQEGLFTLADAAERVAARTTDAAGRVVFADVPWGRYWLGAAPATELPGSGGEVSARKHAVEVAAAEVEVSLVLERGAYLSGFVLGVDGEPAPGVLVEARGEGWNAAPAVRSDDDGAFALGPLPTGPCAVRAQAGAGLGQTAWTPVQGGDQGLVLRLALGGQVLGRVVDDATGEPAVARVLAWGPDGDPPGMTWSGTEGRFSIAALPPGRYDLCAGTDDGRIGLLREVQVGSGAEVGGLVIALERGATLAIVLEGAAGPQRFRVEDGAGTPIASPWVRPGERQTVSVPAGAVRVVPLVPGEMGEARTFQVAAGETVEAAFGARERR